MRKVALLVSFLWLPLGVAPAATNTFLGRISSDWFTSENWDQNRIPTVDDVVVVVAKWVDGVNSNSVFARLELRDGGRLMGDVHVQTALDCYFGDIVGSLRVYSNGLLRVLGPVSKVDLGGPCYNAGTVIVGAGLTYRWSWNSVVWNNLPGGLLQLEGAAEIQGWDGPLINAGTIRKTSSSAKTFLNVQVINTGSIEIETGSIEFARGLTSNGDLFIADSAAGVARAGVYNLAQGHRVTGNGPFVIGGDIQFQGALHDRLDWTNGTLSGQLVIASNGFLNLRSAFGNQTFLAQGTTVTNHGLVNLMADWWHWPWQPNVIWHNAASGRWEIFGLPQVLGRKVVDGLGSKVINAGTIRCHSPEGFELRLDLDNHGSIELESGHFTVLGRFVSDGRIVVGPDASTSFIEGTLELRQGHSMQLSVSNSPVIQVQGSAQLDGHLAVSAAPGSRLIPGTIIQIITFTDRTGVFQTFSGLGISPGLRFDVLHQDSDVSIQVVVPQNRLSAGGFSEAGFTFTFDGDADCLYDIQASTDLAAWQTLFQTNSPTGVILFRDDKAASHPWRFYKLRSAGL